PSLPRNREHQTREPHSHTVLRWVMPADFFRNELLPILPQRMHLLFELSRACYENCEKEYELSSSDSGLGRRECSLRPLHATRKLLDRRRRLPLTSSSADAIGGSIALARDSRLGTHQP